MALTDQALALLRRLDPEQAHRLTVQALALGLGPRQKQADEPILRTTLFGRELANPLGLAAGFDKHAEVMAPLLAAGFGFVEVGSITPEPQPGNPRPRVFRLPEDGAVINRYGFNSRGMERAARRLAGYRTTAGRGFVGVNLGKNKQTADAAADYARGAARLAMHADYLVVNLSSPNTPGLRALQGRQELESLIARVRAALPQPAPPLLLKIAPDLTEADLEDIAAVALDVPLDGLIVSNTTITRPSDLQSAAKTEAGGLSGHPLFGLSTEVLRQVYRLTGGALPLIGVGGISSGAEAYAKLRAGASAVQLYTTLVYEGPALIQRIKVELAECLRRDGLSAPADAVGRDAGR